MWKFYDLLSALFASLTAICAKVDVKNINSDLANGYPNFCHLNIDVGYCVFRESSDGNKRN